MCVNVCSTWTAVVLLFLFHSSFFVHISANTICSSFICTFVWHIRCFNYCRTATILLYQVKRQKCYLFSVFTFFNVNKKNGHPLKDAYRDGKTIFLPPSTERRRMWKQEAAHSRGREWWMSFCRDLICLTLASSQSRTLSLSFDCDGNDVSIVRLFLQA